MIGSVIIDSIDIFLTYNSILLRGGDIDLLSLPERKEPDSVSWYEKTGLDVDLSEVCFLPKQVTMTFSIRSEDSRTFIRLLDPFYRMISAPGYRQVYLRSLNRTFSLRYVSCKDYLQRGRFSKSGTKSADISVEFSMDDPLQVINQEYGSTVSENTFQTYVTLNNTDLSVFGIVVNNIYSTALVLPAQKPVLTLENSITSGVVADVDSPVTYEPFDVRISCTMKAASISQFYDNYSALFALLASDSELSLKCSAAGRAAKCYYVRQENFEKKRSFTNGVLVTFELVLKSIDLQLLRCLLGSTSGLAILTTDNKLIVLE